MSHRKFEAPRHGHLGFLPRKRASRHRGRVKAFPEDDPKSEPHFTAFLSYKAGMTHVTRFVTKPGSGLHKGTATEAVTILDCPPMICVGVVGYVRTPQGLRAIGTAWGKTLDDTFRRRMYKRWGKSNKKAFTKYLAKVAAGKASVEESLAALKANAEVIRAICHTQTDKLPIKQKKAHVAEIQINGGSIEAKVDFVAKYLEQPVPVAMVFGNNDLLDAVGVTKGHGYEGVVARWGVTRLPRKTHRGLRKVACIGAWHPANVQYSVARAGQRGFFHRTELNKKVYRVDKSADYDAKGAPRYFNATVESDPTEKTINPLGGFVRYGLVKNDYVMVRGSCPGPVKRVVTLRQSIRPVQTTAASEKIDITFIDTSSKFGAGQYQTAQEKHDKFGDSLKVRLRKSREEAATAASA